MGVMNLQTMTKSVLNDPDTRKFLAAFLAHIPEDDAKTNNMSAEQLFLSPPAWAYFASYQSILYIAYARAKVITIGVDDPIKLLDPEPFREVLKAALPHRSDYIDSLGIEAFPHLLKELEEIILKELRLMLEGRETDQAEITRALEITATVNRTQAASEEEVATAQATRGGVA
jgi:hypothetical protein